MTTLVVFVPGAASRRERYDALLEKVTQDQADCIVRAWHRPMSVLSRAGLSDRADDLDGQIENWLLELREAGTIVDEVVLVGHSVGGLVARDAYLTDLEGNAAWAPLVTRIALLATPNRGVDPKRLRFGLKFLARATGWALTDKYVWKQAMRGSAYVTNLRVRWIRQFNRPDFSPPGVVQIRAEQDDMVHREDSRDVEQFRGAGEVVASGSTHANLASLEGAEEDVAQRVRIIRRALFGEGFTTDPPEVPAHEAVVIILHGIRAEKTGWLIPVAEAITQASGSTYLPVRPSYGYLPAFDFAVPPLRRARRRWIRDTYSDLVAQYPSATFHFVGHSNGTYLFSKLLETVPASRFESVFLAGCVLRQNYPWQELLGSGPSGRLGRLLHVRASADWPVGWLCSFLRGIRMRELGTAGLNGFDTAHAQLDEPFCVVGDHSAAMTLDGAPERIARWTVEGSVVQPPAVQLADGPRPWFSFVSRAFGNLLLAAAAVALGVAGVSLSWPLVLVIAGTCLLALAFVLRVI